MDRKWLDLIEQGGDASIGSALVRLAREAERVHAMEAARQACEKSEAPVVGGTDRTQVPAAWTGVAASAPAAEGRL